MSLFKRMLSVMLLLCLLCGFAAAETAEDPATVTRLDFENRWLKIDDIISEIEKYPNLKQVDMYGTPVGIINMGKLSELFPNITFGWTIRFKEHAIRSDATSASTKHSFKSLHHTPVQIALLRYCTQLKALDIEFNNCDDLSFTSGMKDMRVLVVASNQLTDISPVADLAKLEYLDLSGNKITDITPLAGLTRLMDLNLSNNNITDLTPLMKLTSLKRLWLNRACRGSEDQLSEENIQKLKEALPDTEIVWTGKPDWKASQHFKVIHKMFGDNKGYVPFEDSYTDE